MLARFEFREGITQREGPIVLNSQLSLPSMKNDGIYEGRIVSSPNESTLKWTRVSDLQLSIFIVWTMLTDTFIAKIVDLLFY